MLDTPFTPWILRTPAGLSGPGATGYVGGHLLTALLARGERVRCLARRPEALPSAEGHHWKPVFYEIGKEHAEAYRQAGFNTLPIGHEAVVDLQGFNLAGSKNKGIRSAVNRLKKQGYQANVVAAPLPDKLVAELRQVSDSWLTMMHGKEKRFSLGAFDDAYLKNGPALVVTDAQGKPVAFANIVPEYQKNELTVDLMRRTPEAPRGTMEFLFASLFEWGKEHGYQTASMGCAPLSGVGEQKGDPMLEKLVHLAYEHGNRFYSFKGLRAFKDKWDPTWHPVYLAWQGAPTGLPGTMLALLALSSGDGFMKDCAGEIVSHLHQPPAQ
ncbi:MAG: phosphatidylglycerol lysyltransferase domain-containing protein [Candidatus Xenobia bacterium]